MRTLSLQGAIGDNWWAQPFPRQADLASLQRTLPELFDSQVAADGSFALHDMPEQALVYLAADGPGLGQAQWFNALLPERKIPDCIEIAIEPEAVYAGRVLDPGGKPVVNAAVRLRISSRGRAFGVRRTFPATTGRDGTFRLDGLPRAEFDLHVDSPAGVSWPRTFGLTAGERILDDVVELEREIVVSGTVVDDVQQPLEGANVTAITSDRRRLRLGGSRSGPRGRFSLRLPPGKVEIYFSGIPTGFASPDPQVVETLTLQPGDPAITGLVLELARKQQAAPPTGADTSPGAR